MVSVWLQGEGAQSWDHSQQVQWAGRSSWCQCGFRAKARSLESLEAIPTNLPNVTLESVPG